MASCGLCDEDSTSSCTAEKDAIIAFSAAYEELAAQLAEKDAIIASMTSPPPPPTPPPGADYPCDRAYNLLTLTQAYDWYAPHKDAEHTRRTHQTHTCASLRHRS